MHKLDNTTTDPMQDIYENYLTLGGTMPRPYFDKVFRVLCLLMADVYTGTIREEYQIEVELRLPRSSGQRLTAKDVAWGHWQQFIVNIDQSLEDAFRIYQAADAFSGYEQIKNFQ